MTAQNRWRDVLENIKNVRIQENAIWCSEREMQKRRFDSWVQLNSFCSDFLDLMRRTKNVTKQDLGNNFSRDQIEEMSLELYKKSIPIAFLQLPFHIFLLIPVIGWAFWAMLFLESGNIIWTGYLLSVFRMRRKYGKHFFPYGHFLNFRCGENTVDNECDDPKSCLHYVVS